MQQHLAQPLSIIGYHKAQPAGHVVNQNHSTAPRAKALLSFNPLQDGWVFQFIVFG